MPSATPASAIETRLRAGLPSTAIKTSSDAEEAPNPPVKFIRLEFPGGTAEQITIGAPGDNRWRDRAVFMLHIAVPRAAECEAVCRNLADEAAGLFRGASFSGVECQAPYPPAEDTGPNGNYWGLSFAVPYQFDRYA